MFGGNSDRHIRMVRSAPMRVVFSGFESDTLALQAAGWQLSVDQGMDHRSGRYMVTLIGKHEKLGLYFYCSPVRISPHEMYSDLNDRGFVEDAEFFVECMGDQIHFRKPVMVDPARMQPIDARPETRYVDNITMMGHEMFKPVHVGEDFEIYLNKKDEAELMDIILKKQDPKQKEIRQNRRRRAWEDVNSESSQSQAGYDPYGDIKGQLIVVGG